MATASSSFTGTENPLSEGGVWAAPTAAWSTLQKTNGIKVTSTGADSARRYVGVTFAADQFSEVVLAAVPSGGLLFFHYCMVRMNTTAGCYLVTTAADVAANVIQLFAIDNSGNFNQIGTNITLGANCAAGDTMRLTVVGTTLTVTYNGSVVRTATDSTWSSGQPAVGGWAQNSSSNVVFTSSWNAADIVNPLDDGASIVPRCAPPSPFRWQIAAFDDELPGAAAAIIDEDPSWPVTPWPLAWVLRSPMLDDDIGGIDFGPAAGHVRITGVSPDLEVYDGEVPGVEIYDGPVPGSETL